jgi:hypothetical protein
LKKLAVIVAAVVVLAVGWGFARRWIPSHVDYRGERFRLTKLYLTYDGYKNDPDNLHPSEIERVQRLVSTAVVPSSFPSWKAASRTIGEISFPGYGSGSLQSDWDRIRAFSIEIPLAEQDRILVLRARGPGYTVVDDFLADAALVIRGVEERAGSLAFTNPRGETVLTRTLSPEAE